MIRPKVGNLLIVSIWLAWIGGGRCVGRADELRRLPSVIRIRAEQPVPQQPTPVAAPAESPPPATVRQVVHLSQPEYPEAYEGFGGPMPVQRLVEHALANNPGIQAARYQAAAMGARVPQVKSLPDPQLMTSVFLESIETAAGPQEVAVSLSQKFPFFGKLALRSQVAYYDAMAAYARVAAVELRVVEQVKRAYYDVYFLQRSIEVIRALEPELEDIIEIANTKFENNVPKAGLESVLQARVELSSLKTKLVELKQTKIEAQARLAEVLGLPPGTRIDASLKIGHPRVTHTARLLVELAESYQPELSVRSHEVSRDRTSVALARRAYWPDATLSFNWFEIGSPGLSPVATGEDAFSLGVGVNLPIYRRRLDAAEREARFKTARSARQYVATRDQVYADVQRLYAQFTQHHEILEILGTEIVPRAQRTLELSVEAYRVGNLEFQQMIDNYNALLKFKIDLYQREALREQAIAGLERAVGTAISAAPLEAAEDSQPVSIPPPPGG